MTPDVSIIIPTRNALAWLPAAIASVGADPRVEILVVDDGSTDGSAAWLAQQAAADPRLRVLPGGGDGPSVARNLAIQQAQLTLLQSMTKDDASGQVATFNHLLDQYGPGAGAAFFDKIVVIFVEHLAISGAAPYARKAADHAREVMGITPGSQLDADMIRLVDRLDGARN